MKRLIKLISCFVLAEVLLFESAGFCANYYVDYNSGNDGNSGTSQSAAWKHCPGDKNAASISLSAKLAAGDTVLFKGGVYYRGSISLLRLDPVGSPVTLKGDGWGLEKAILDGSEPIAGSFTQCPSQDDCAGNPNWENIYFVNVSTSFSFDTGFYEDDEFLWYSQDPNPGDPFLYDKSAYLRVIPKSNPSVSQTRTSITDPRYFTQSDPNFWNGAYVISWRVPNVMSIKKITSYDPASHTVYHEDLGNDIYTDRDSYYSVLNHLSMLDTPGEFSYDAVLGKLYVWPRNSNIAQHNYSVRSQSAGIFSNSSKNVVLEGFIVQKYTFGIRAIDGGGGPIPENVTIKNNEVRNLKCNDWYAIQVKGNNMIVENNRVTYAQRGVGILAGGDNVTIRNNYVKSASRQGIWFMEAKNSSISNNSVYDCKGTHANGISVYQNSENVTVSANKVFNSNIAFTTNDSKNINVINNIFDGNDLTGNVFASFGGLTGTLNVFNNTIINSNSNYAMYISGCGTNNQVTMRNNIIDGGGCGDHKYNLYTALAWNQELLGEGELKETDLTKIFTDPLNLNYQLLESGSATDRGINLSASFTLDIQGITRPQGSGWDIGAYEYTTPTQSNITPPSAPRRMRVK